MTTLSQRVRLKSDLAYMRGAGLTRLYLGRIEKSQMMDHRLPMIADANYIGTGKTTFMGLEVFWVDADSHLEVG